MHIQQVIMVKFKIIFHISISMLMSSLAIGQNIDIKVYNKTGYDLDSVSFSRFYLGKLNKDSTVFLDAIDEITLQGDVPLNRPFGIIEGKKRPFNLKSCATKSKKKKSGSYAFNILIHETGDDYHLYWNKHE